MSTDAMRAALEQLSFVFVNEGETAAEAIRRVRDVARAALAQPVSAEPVADVRLYEYSGIAKNGEFFEAVLRPGAKVSDGDELYTAPPASAERVPLTDEQIASATSHVLGHAPGYYVTIARAIERAHGITAKVAP